MRRSARSATRRCKEPLVQRDPEQRCEKEQGQVMRGDMFAAGKQRQDPERCRGADHPQSGERQRTDQTALQYGFRHGRHDTQSRLAPSMARWPVYILFDCIDDLFKFFNWDSSDPLNFLKFSGCTEKSHFCTYPCAKVLFFRFGCLTPDRLLK